MITQQLATADRCAFSSHFSSFVVFEVPALLLIGYISDQQALFKDAFMFLVFPD